MAWWELLLRLAMATAIGCVIGVERERKHRPAGVRTHVLLCVGAATIGIMECLMSAETGGMTAAGVTLTRGRLGAQVISGIGFLGAGTIFMSQKKIAGLTTAASLWNVACLGLACGFGYYYLALAGCVVVMLVLTVMLRIFRARFTRQLEIKFSQRAETMSVIDQFFSCHDIKVVNIDFHIENQSEQTLFTNLYTLEIPARASYPDLVRELAGISDVQSVRTIND